MGQDNHNGADPRGRDQDPRPEPDQNDDDGGGRSASAVPGIPPAPQGYIPGPFSPNTPDSAQQDPFGQQPHNPWDRQSPQWGPPAAQPGAPAQPWGAPGYLQQGGWTPPPKPGVIPLRPLGLGELLDGAFQACRKNPGATFGTALLIQAVISLLTFLLAGQLLSTTVYSTNFDTAEFEVSGSDVAWSLTGLTLLGVVSVVGVLLLQGVLVVPIARSILNLKTGFAPTWKLCRSRLLALAGLGLVLTAMAVAGLVLFGVVLGLLASVLGAAGVPVVIIGILALVAVCVWLVVRLALAPAALVLEPAGIFGSLRRSWLLTRRNFWRSFGILALTAILVSIVSSVISVPVVLIFSFVTALGSGAEPNPGAAMALVALNIAITTFFSAIGYAFQAAVTSLLYVDLRMRREGFDLTLMKEQELVGANADLVPGRGSGTSGNPRGSATPPGTGPAPYGGPPDRGYNG